MHDLRVGQSEDNSGKLIRVDKCLYRLTSTGMYYAVIRHEGKLHRRSLETTVRATANRRLEDERRKITAVDKRAGRVTLASLCDEYLETLRNAPKTKREMKTTIKDNVLHIETLPHAPRPSATGKTLKVASSNGNNDEAGGLVAEDFGFANDAADDDYDIISQPFANDGDDLLERLEDALRTKVRNPAQSGMSPQKLWRGR